MERAYFKKLEHLCENTKLNLADFIEHLAFNDDGLIPVITQDAASKRVLMFAWMNAESLALTIETKRMTYWSRSRKKLWKKGESSGHAQSLVSMSFDCDGDVILCEVEQIGAACHTGRTDCFYLKLDFESNKIVISSDTPDGNNHPA